MKTRHLLVCGLITLCSAAILSQTLPSTSPAKAPRQSVGGSSGEAQIFTLQGKRYRAKISHEEVSAGPDWRPALALPLRLSQAEEVARAELDKWLPGTSGGEVTELRLKRLRGDDKWYCAVRLAPTAKDVGSREDSFCLLMNLSGTPGTWNYRLIGRVSMMTGPLNLSLEQTAAPSVFHRGGRFAAPALRHGVAPSGCGSVLR
jgi:hypothetical protein